MLVRFQDALQAAPQSHAKGTKGQGGAVGGGKGKGRGNEKGKGKGKGQGKGAGAERRPGDWGCACGAWCFESKDSCYRCHTPRGGTAKVSGGGTAKMPGHIGGSGGGFGHKGKGKGNGKGAGGRAMGPRGELR
jgi:hypothetical protein